MSYTVLGPSSGGKGYCDFVDKKVESTEQGLNKLFDLCVHIRL